MAAYWQSELSVAGALDNGVSLERVFNVVELQLLPDSHQGCVAGEDIFAVKVSVLVLPPDKGVVVMAAYW